MRHWGKLILCGVLFAAGFLCGFPGNRDPGLSAQSLTPQQMLRLKSFAGTENVSPEQAQAVRKLLEQPAGAPLPAELPGDAEAAAARAAAELLEGACAKLRAGRATEDDLRQACTLIQTGRLPAEQVLDACGREGEAGLSAQRLQAACQMVWSERISLGAALESLQGPPRELAPAADRPAERPAMLPPAADRPAERPGMLPPDVREAAVRPAPARRNLFAKPDIPELRRPEIFGRDLFSQPTDILAPFLMIPAPDNYILGPGDEIRIMLWGRLEEKYTLEVNKEGVIEFPRLGPIEVAGLPFREVEALLKSKAEAITGVNVNVTMGRLRAIQVFVLGDVMKPGLYTVSALSTPLNALLAAGGPQEIGSMRRIEIKRGGERLGVFDLYDFLLRGQMPKEFRLNSEDVIFVPQRGPAAAVTGDVHRPAVYEFKEAPATLGEALEYAGGLTPSAYGQRIQVERFQDNERRIVLDVPYGVLEGRPSVRLQDGDLVRVFSVHQENVNAVFLYGHVKRQGQHAVSPNMRLLDLFPSRYDDLFPDTALDYGVVRRYVPREMKYEILSFNLGQVLSAARTAENLLLKPMDEVYVFSKGMFADEPMAAVKGQVRDPGEYPIDDMRVRDLIQKAGGLTAEAYLEKAQIVRTHKDFSRETIYFNVARAMEGDPKENVRVENLDRVIVHSVWDMKFEEQVEIKGEVKSPGAYPLTRGMRVSDLVFKAGELTRDSYLEQAHVYRTDWRTKEQTILTVDLGKALAGCAENDLVLRDLDQLWVHSVWEYTDRFTVTIRGQVNKPGQYPYAGNMRVRDLVLVGGNVQRDAYLSNAEIYRFVIEEGKLVRTSVIPFSVEEAFRDNPEHNLPLEPHDVVNIRRIPDYGETRSVTVQGEVLFPGEYNISKGERLSSVLARAGGYTDSAYLRGAVFSRESVRNQQQRRLDEMTTRLRGAIATAYLKQTQEVLSAEDLIATKQILQAQENLLSKLETLKALGRVVVKLAPLAAFKGTPSDIILEHGDTLTIPEQPHTVTVAGEVYNPTAIIYNPGHSKVKHYLGLAGGPTQSGAKKQIYLVRSDGTVESREQDVWLFSAMVMANLKNKTMYPGDMLVVPPRYQYPNYLKDIKDVTTIIFELALASGVVAALL